MAYSNYKAMSIDMPTNNRDLTAAIKNAVPEGWVLVSIAADNGKLIIVVGKEAAD